MEVTESTTRVYAQAPPGLSTAGSTTYPQQQTGSTYPSSTHVGTGTTYPSSSNVGSSYPSTSNVGSSYTHPSSSHLGTGATTGTGLGTSMGHPVASSSSSAYGAGSGYEKSAGYGSGAAGYGSEKVDTTHPVPVSSNPFDKNVSYASGSGAYNPSHPVGGVVPGQHAVPIGYDNNLVSGIALRPGLAFPLGDVPYSSRTGSIVDLILAALGILGLLAISAISDWAIDHQGRKGWYFGSACMAFFGLFFWFAVTWWGWRYARESVTLSQGARAFWVGLLIGGAVSAVMWGATIHPLRYQFERWRLDGSRFDQKKTTHLMLVNALALPLMDQALILVALFWMTTRKRFRLWRPYSYLVVAVGLEIGSWFAQQIIVYSVFPAWHTAAGAYAGDEYFARGLYGEALFFLLCAVLFFVCAGLLAGGARAIHQLPDRDQVEMAHVGDMPPELFPGPLAASVLLMMMLVLRAIPELFRLAVLTQGGQSFAATKTSIVLVYLLVGILGLVLLRHRIRSTLPVVLALDPTGYTVAHRPKHVGMAPMFHHHGHHSSALAANPNSGVVTRV